VLEWPRRTSALEIGNRLLSGACGGNFDFATSNAVLLRLTVAG
jgi:hypothetical protein